MASMVVGTGGAGTSRAIAKASGSAAPAIPLGDPALDAALRYFGTHGLRATALDDVARSGDLDVREVSRRYPTSRCLALGIFERMLELLGEQLEEQSKRGATLTERLQSWFELELQLLEPCKPLVRSWLIDSLSPLSPTALLQGPLAFRYGARITRELELARDRGEISGWVLPGLAAGGFIGLRRSLILGWLGDDSAGSDRTLPFARAEIAAFVRLLAPWPGLDEVRPSRSPASGVREPRALPAPREAAERAAPGRALPVAPVNLREESAGSTAPVRAAAVQTAAVELAAVQAEPVAIVPPEIVPPEIVAPEMAQTAEAAPAAAVNAAIAQAPAVLGTLAQAEAAPEVVASLGPEAAAPSEPPPIGNGAPAPVKPGGETSSARSKRRSRSKRSKH